MSHALRSNTVKGATMKQTVPNGESPSQRIDAKIKSLDDWRGDISTCSRGGIICTDETYKGDSVPLRRAA